MSGRRFRLGIRGRIVFAMLVPLALALGASGWASVTSVSGAVEERERERIEEARDLFGEIARTLVAAPDRPDFLRRVAGALGGDVLVHDRSRESVRTTLEDGEAAAVTADAALRSLRDVPVREPTRWRTDGFDGLVLAERLGAHDVYLIYRGDPVRDAADRATEPIVLAAAIALVVAAALAVLLATLVVRPLRQLTAQTASIARGDLDGEVAVRSRDETGDLAASFNRMLDGLRTYRRDLVRAERLAALGRIASGIAHELRNPLTAVRMNVQMLPGEDDRATREEEVEDLLAEIDRLERTIDDLVALARPDDLKVEPIDVRALVEGTVSLLGRQLEHLRVRVAVESDPDLPALPADERRLRQVLMNLLLNAAHAMPEGGDVRVEIAEAAGRVRIDVVDGGDGVPDELAPQLFEPFASGRPGGTGLGLAVSRQIVEAHGGEIAYRRLGRETVFSVTLRRDG